MDAESAGVLLVLSGLVTVGLGVGFAFGLPGCLIFGGLALMAFGVLALVPPV